MLTKQPQVLNDTLSISPDMKQHVIITTSAHLVSTSTAMCLLSLINFPGRVGVLVAFSGWCGSDNRALGDSEDPPELLASPLSTSVSLLLAIVRLNAPR